MINWFAHWWCRYKLKQTLKRGDRRQAEKLLQQILRSGKSLTWWELLFYEQLKQGRSQKELQHQILLLEHQRRSELPPTPYLTPDSAILDQLKQKFQIKQHDQYKRQITGIDHDIFDEFELQLANYLQQEFSKQSIVSIQSQLKQALDDLNNLKRGSDPSYTETLTPHIYFMKYFLENTYSLYLAWLFVYENGLLSLNCKILDIGAGPATAAYGLALFFQSLNQFNKNPQTHISYFSLEQQSNFQYRGLQFWRRYIESQDNPFNLYFRFLTEDIAKYSEWSKKIPQSFFDVIVVSHCFSTDNDNRNNLIESYREIFKKHLNQEGFILLIIQDKKLFKMYDCFPSEDSYLEQEIILKFVQELDLKLITYQYFTSTPDRNVMRGKDFRLFAEQYLPKQQWISPLLERYLNQKFKSHYTLDDYVILAHYAR